jgi:hypothetical protein
VPRLTAQAYGFIHSADVTPDLGMIVNKTGLVLSKTASPAPDRRNARGKKIFLHKQRPEQQRA